MKGGIMDDRICATSKLTSADPFTKCNETIVQELKQKEYNNEKKKIQTQNNNSLFYNFCGLIKLFFLTNSRGLENIGGYIARSFKERKGN